MSKKIIRCAWAGETSLAYIEYHDKEWGVPVWDDQTQFEFLILEGAQAGLSWSTILNKREGYRKNFAAIKWHGSRRNGSKKFLRTPALCETS